LNSKFVLIIFIWLFTLSAIPRVQFVSLASGVPSEILVGVEVGDWVNYTLLATWSTNVPDAEPPAELVELNRTEWVKTTVLAISGTNITFQAVAHYKNSTATTSDDEYVDLKTGESSPIGILMFIPSNLLEGDRIHASPTEHYSINETVVRTYMGVARETNLLNVTTVYYEGPSLMTVMSTNYYWDRATGVLCERLGAQITYVEGAVTTIGISEKIVDTNLWVGQPDMPPLAKAGPDRTVLKDTSVSFDASASYDPDGTIEMYEWDFGDGNPITVIDPIVTHTYTKLGTYTVTLTVWDAVGNSDTDTMTVTVEETSTPPILWVLIVVVLLLGLLFFWRIRAKK
jgi:hypothetical protein